MTTQTEALKLALDYIIATNKSSQFWLVPESKLNKTVTAIKEALAQPEQRSVSEHLEPVAHRDGFWCADLTCKKCYSADFRFKYKNSVVNDSLTTQAQRTWVGLTNEERAECWETIPELAMRKVEAKLKDKNI